MDDRERWDAKYAGELRSERTAPDKFVLAALERIPACGRALDLAAGTGRHALELARRGFEVTAWDVSPVGLAILRERAREANVAVTTHAVDVLADPTPGLGEPFDLVVCVLFLDRGLMNHLARLVAPGGHLIFATATTELAGERPPMRFRLEPGELARGLADFETVFEREVEGRAGILARKPVP